jgi:hypothetical protein
MTEKEAIELAIKGWEKLAADGNLGKTDIPEFKGLAHFCPLCDLVGHGRIPEENNEYCLKCPYTKKFNPGAELACDRHGTPFRRWYVTIIPAERQHYAAAFVAQLKELLPEVQTPPDEVPKKRRVEITPERALAFVQEHQYMVGWEMFEDVSGDSRVVLVSVGFPYPPDMYEIG